MKITVLAASGPTGLELTRQALDRGHVVTAIARTPAKVSVSSNDRLRVVQADVLDVDAIATALIGTDTLVSGLGIAEGEPPGVLVAGAQAAVDAGVATIIWLGAFGTGESAAAAGALTRGLLGRFMRKELPDKTAADQTVLRAGGTVFHAGPMSNKPLSPNRRTTTLASAPRRIFPAFVSRATVAAAMLDEAEHHTHPGMTLVPLDH